MTGECYWRVLIARAACDELQQSSMCNAFNGDQINLSVVLIKRDETKLTKKKIFKVSWIKSLDASRFESIASSLASSCFQTLPDCMQAIASYSRIRNCDLMRLLGYWQIVRVRYLAQRFPGCWEQEAFSSETCRNSCKLLIGTGSSAKWRMWSSSSHFGSCVWWISSSCQTFFLLPGCDGCSHW